MRKRGGSLGEARASGLGEELIFLVGTRYGWVVGEVVSVGEGRLDAREVGFILFLGGVFGSGKKFFWWGVSGVAPSAGRGNLFGRPCSRDRRYE